MLLKAASFASAIALTSSAQAQFAVAPPPEQPASWTDDLAFPSPHETFVRARIGPALRLTNDGSGGGLASALDFGSTSGVRVSAVWTAVGADVGHAQYGGDLWLSLLSRSQLRPVLAAGAAYVHERRPDNPSVDGMDTATSEATPDFGVATARVGMEYLFPLEAADARLAAEAVGSVPAINAHDRAPWVTLAATLALGF